MKSYELAKIREIAATNGASSLLIICANQRQARNLQQNEHLSTANVCCMPEIYTVENWFKTLWMEFQDRGIAGSDLILVDEFEESILWREVVEETPDKPALIDSHRLSQQLQEAYKICSDYAINLSNKDEFNFEERDFFVQTLSKFKGKLNQLRLTTVVEFAKSLNSSTTLAKYLNSVQVLFFGFVEIPALLLSICANASIAPAKLTRPSIGGNPKKLEFDTERSEIVYAAKWAKSILNLDNGAEAVIIVPDLQKSKQKIRRQLEIEFSVSQFLFSDSHQVSALYDISAGEPLAEIPIIAAALALNNLFLSRINTEDAKAIIRSKYWGAGFDSTRQFCLLNLEVQRESQISRSRLINLLKFQRDQIGGDINPTDSDSTRITQLMGQFSWPNNHRKTVTEWIDILLSSYKVLNFPCFSPNSYEYQAFQSFSTMLEKLKKQDGLFSRSHDVKSFLALVSHAAQSVVFHPEVKLPKIRVLGIMEAAGLAFEHCLIIRMSEANFPSSPSPNPFIPIQLQRERNTPRSSAQREYLYAETLLKSIISNCKNLTLSYSRQNVGEVTRESPVSDALVAETMTPKQILSDTKNELENYFSDASRASSLVKKPLGKAPVIPKDSVISGGAYHLNLYSANPLYSFFRYRLHMNEANVESLGIDPRLYGVLVHSVLASFYKKHSTIDAIKVLIASGRLTKELANISEQYLLEDGKNIPYQLTRFIADRLVNSLHHFIELDAGRSSNFTVENTELSINATVKDWTYHLRLDRIDRLDTGLFIIDYKTGATSLTGLTKNSLIDFQLPLYTCCFYPAEVAGSAYAVISDDQPAYCGFGEEQLGINGIVKASAPYKSELNGSWLDLLDHWRTQVESVTTEIANGHVPYEENNRKLVAAHNYLSLAIRQEEKL